MNAPANYDEVVHDLIANFGRDATTAQDAAVKVAKLGRRAVPMLTDVLKANLPAAASADDKTPPAKGNAQVAFCAVLALSRIKTADAAKALLPVLNNPKAGVELRLVALEALGLEVLPDSAAALQKIAASDPEMALRRKAYSQLIMPAYWVASEKLFVDALSDPDNEIRALAAKQCYYTRIYTTSADKLIAAAEKDEFQPVRVNAMLALARMRVRKAVPALVRVIANADTPPAMLQQALRTLDGITGVSLKDAKAVESWWQRMGQAEYAKLEAPPKAPETPDTKKAGEPVPDKNAGEKKAAP